MSTTIPSTPTDTSSDPAIASIIATARSEDVPYTWSVWPLQRGYVAKSALKWGLLGALFIVFFIPALIIMVPADYTGLLFTEIFATIILAFLAAVAFGGVGIAVYDLWRLARAAEFLLIVTPDDYVKVAPGKVTHVPMSEIARVTLRGVKVPAQPMASAGTGGGGRLYGEIQGFSLLRVSESLDNIMMRKNAQGPRSLAFLDLRTHREVVVSVDDSFGSLLDLEQAINMYAKGVEIIKH